MFNERKYYPKHNNKIIIKVWPRQASSSSPKTWLSTGHVALKIYVSIPGKQNYYISFWPGVCHESYDPTGKKSYSQCVCNQSIDHFHTEDEDNLMYKTAPPDGCTVHLDTFDSIEINKAFDKFKKSEYRWELLGSSIFKDNNTYNCCGLTLYLLQAGGLRNIIPNYMEILSAFSKTGIAGAYVKNELGERILTICRIGCTGLILLIYCLSLCNYDPANKQKFSDSINLLRNSFICGLSGGIIGIAKTYFDTLEVKHNSITATIIGFISGFISGGILTAALKYIAEQYSLIPSNKYGKFTPIFSIIVFYSTLTIFGENSFLTQGAAKALGVTFDTPTGEGIIITPQGILNIANKAKEVEVFKERKEANTLYKFFENFFKKDDKLYKFVLPTLLGVPICFLFYKTALPHCRDSLSNLISRK